MDIEIVSYNQVHKIVYTPDNLIIDEAQKMGGWRTRKGRKLITTARKVKHIMFLSATMSYNTPLDWFWPLKLCGQYPGVKNDFLLDFCGAFRLPNMMHLIQGKPTNMDTLSKLIEAVEVYTGTDRKLKINKNIIKFKAPIETKPKFIESSTVRKEVSEFKYKIFEAYHKKGKLAKRAVIFTHHIELTKQIAQLLGADYISGEVTAKSRAKILEDFCLQKKDYVVISTLCGGAGINIFNCDTCYFAELSFSPKVHEQAYLRLVRTEEDTEINVHYFIAEDEIETEHANNVIDRKNSYFKELEE